jgi:hypothetical protein
MRYPKEFSRHTRNFSEYDRFKVTETRMLTLYGLEMMVTNSNIGNTLLQAIRLLTLALRILSCKRFYRTYASEAATFASSFVTTCRLESVFGDRFVVMMVHLLEHIGEESLRLGPLETFSTFKFENTLKTIKERTRSSKNPLANITKKLKVQATFVSKASRTYFNKNMVSQRMTSGRYGTLSTRRLYLSNRENENRFPDAHFGTSHGFYQFESVERCGTVVHAYMYSEATHAYEVQYIKDGRSRRFRSGNAGVWHVSKLGRKLKQIPVHDITEKYAVHNFFGKLYAYSLISC